jgi:DNA-binding XRE family transcriptional regulator
MIRSDEMGRTLEQLIADEKTDVVADAQMMATEILLNIHLAELREKVQKTQVEIAKNLGIRQPTVASMEKPGRDLKLSTLKRYVEATGGKLRLDIELPDGSHYQFAI